MASIHNRLINLIADKEIKEKRKIPLSEVARATHISEHTIGRWVRNSVERFDAPVLVALCKYFNCTVGDLLYVEDDDEG